MRAWCVDQPGGPEALQMRDIDAPQPGGQEVQIKVRAIGINRADLLQRRGLYPAPPGFDPRVPGLEYAGIVEQTGPRARLRKTGDRVMGLIGGGAYAERLVVHEGETIAVPPELDFNEAAAIPEAFLTAYRALFIEGGAGVGDWCVVRAATSGVGIAAIQLCRALGARTVGTSRRRERLERLYDLGLDVGHVDGDVPLVDTVHRNGRGADVLLDLLGGGHLEENLDALRDEGTMVLVGRFAGAEDRIDLGRFLARRLTLRAMTMRSLPVERKIQLAKMFESRLDPLFADGRLKPVLDSVFPFGDAPQAHAHVEANLHSGKVVLAL